LDLLTIHERILPMGPRCGPQRAKRWALHPKASFDEIRRTARYRAEDFQRVASDPPVDPAATMRRLREILEEAEAFVMRMPTDAVGLLFLQEDRVVQPDPGRLGEYRTHAGQKRGQWPSSMEISAAMLEHYSKKPNP
jgi:hypothetical protein